MGSRPCDVFFVDGNNVDTGQQKIPKSGLKKGLSSHEHQFPRFKSGANKGRVEMAEMVRSDDKRSARRDIFGAIKFAMEKFAETHPAEKNRRQIIWIPHNVYIK